jgi:hypothetical protein
MVVVPGPAVVAVLTRAPSRGGKSRLFAALGRAADPSLLSALLLDTIDGARVNGVSRVAAVEPADACDEVRGLVPEDVRVIAQPSGTLGDRMRATMDRLFADGAALVVLIGSDLPDITPDRIEQAVAHLAGDEDALVLGPTADGGYYLIASRGGAPDVFNGIDWGSDRVLTQTVAAAARLGRRVHLVEPMRDVDTLDDLREVRARRTREWRERWRV